MLAIDLDGTLLGREDRVSAANLDAIRRARAAGLRVAICTGRGLVECMHILEYIEQTDPVVVAGGAIVGCPMTRGTLHRFAIDPELVRDAVRHLDALGHPVMVLKDQAETGYDYLVVEGGHEIDPVSLWWFERMNARVRYVHAIDEDPDPDKTVRLGVCASDERLEVVKADLVARFGSDSTLYHFPAVLGPEHEASGGRGRTVHILEVFNPCVSKWTAISWLAEHHGVNEDRIAAIGDEINDLSMVREAALGVAMDNAVEAVLAVADRRTHSNHDDGVAHAISHMLDGVW